MKTRWIAGLTAVAVGDAPEVAGFEPFVDGLVHDVRGALGTMKTMARLARTLGERGDNLGAGALLLRLDVAVRRTEDLCSDLLECSRRLRRPGAEPAWFEVIDLVEVVRESVADHAGVLHQAQCTATLRAPASAPVRSHRGSLDRVLANLLANAARYGANQVIDVHVESGNCGHFVTVRDHGAGIPDDVLARLFGPPAGDERPEEFSFEHFGLGLWIVRTLVQSLGGQLHVASELGQGTAVSFFLPSSAEQGFQVKRAADPLG